MPITHPVFLKPPPRPTRYRVRCGSAISFTPVEHFDYIVIGAGTAGCVLAERLSQDRSARVLILEAGGSDRRFWIKTPIGYGRTFADPAVNWRYQTQPSAGLNGRRMYWPRGRVLGGSSSINALVYCRGVPADFDAWRDMGNDGWGWEDVKPYFENPSGASMPSAVSAARARLGQARWMSRT